ncbi:diguanylate cyclase [Roseibium sp.]|uniref:sensor domain-containing diguanylate cyclase n=1 Tax=Roseibium sp. TaxID=1936156 RepID=UPI003A96AE4C
MYVFAMVSGVVAIIIFVFLGAREVNNFKAKLSVELEGSATRAQTYIAEFVELRNVMVRAFAEDHNELLEKMLRFPDDLIAQNAVEELVTAYFPSHFAFVAQDADGVFVPDDLGEFVGDACRADMSSYSGVLKDLSEGGRILSENAMLYEPFIHPQPYNYHFDLTSHWESATGKSGLLMISFPPNQLVKILAGHEVPGHNLMLLRKDRSDLIEVTSEGWRENIQREGLLSEDELSRVQFRMPINGTRWEVAYLPSQEVIDDHIYKVEWLTAIAVSLILAMMGIFTWWYFMSERARRSVLFENENLLHQSLGDRTALRTLIDLVPMPIFRNRDGRVEMANGAYAKFLGKPIEMVEGKMVQDLLGKEVADQIREVDAELIAAPGSIKVYEQKVTSGDGRNVRDVVVYKTSMELEGDPVVSTVGAVVDVTEERALQARLEEQAMTDPLTGIPNRRKFMEMIRNELQRSGRFGHPLSIVTVDIDHFKSVNDVHGHDRGDEVIKIVANCLERGVRENIDLAARMGGEEFALLLPETDAEGAMTVSERIREMIEAERIVFGGTTISVTISAGTSTAPAGHTNIRADQLLVQGDKALYASKRGGRNRTTAYSDI